MKRPDDRGQLADILSAIKRIESYMQNISEKKFEQDPMRQDAIMLQIGVIGEAARKVSLEFQNRYPEVPWSKMIGIGILEQP